MSQPDKQTNQIFVCYRREDSAAITGRIYDRLHQKFAKEAVFKDVDSIPYGINYKKHIDSIIRQCAVVLVVIGDRWLEPSPVTEKPKIDEPRDFVRLEIESALARDIPVVPLFVNGASMPPEEALPKSLRELIYRNGTSINNDPYFHTDMDRLIQSLETYLHAPSTTTALPTEETIEEYQVSQPAPPLAPSLGADLARESVEPEVQQSEQHSGRTAQRIVLGIISLAVLSAIVVALIYFKRPKTEPTQTSNIVAPAHSPSPVVSPAASPTPTMPPRVEVKKPNKPTRMSPEVDACVQHKEFACYEQCLAGLVGAAYEAKEPQCADQCRQKLRQFRAQCEGR